jgi:hypothetical protein
MKTLTKVAIGGSIATALGFLAWLAWRAGAAPPPPPPGKAILSIDTTPVKGNVFINGVLVGTAPIRVELDPGTYTVSFGPVSGYITPADILITLAEGQTVERTVVYEEEGVPPVCQEGETKCVGYDLYVCQAGQWQLSKANAMECGYTPPPPPPPPPPPQTGILKVQTGRDRYPQHTSEVYVMGNTYILNDFSGEILLREVPPGVYTVSFGRATHPFILYTPPGPITKMVEAGITTLFFGKYMCVPQYASPCGYKGQICEPVKTGRKVMTNRGWQDELIPVGIGGITVYAWYPAQRDQYGSPRYPWKHTPAQGFNPEFITSTVTDSNGVFSFPSLPVPPDPSTKYCIGFANPVGYEGGGEMQYAVEPGILVGIEWHIFRV